MLIDRRSRVLVVAAVVALLGLACDPGDNNEPQSGSTDGPRASPTAPDSLVIGLVGTLSGPASWRGEDAFQGADAAVSALNRSLDDDEMAFELVGYDDEADPIRATELIRQLSEDPRTAGIIFAGPPEALSSAEGALAEAEIPAVLCYGDLYSPRLLSPHVFQVSPPMLWEARRIASYLLEDRDYRTVGAVVESSLTGRVANSALHEALEEEKGRLARAASYTAGGEGIEEALERLRKRRAEAVVVQGGPPVMARVLGALGAMRAGYRGTAKARLATAPDRVSRKRVRRGYWRPQIVAFDLGGGRIDPGLAPPGTAVSDSLTRGAHYLPIPAFSEFRGHFRNWWGEEPDGWEQRAYEAVGAIGWAAQQGGLTRGEDPGDLAEVMEGIQGLRFGGLRITLGPDDHVSVEESSVGIWVVPRRTTRVRERRRLPSSQPWVPLARGFAHDGGRTEIPSEEWTHLFRNPPPRSAPAPSFEKMLFGVTTRRADPVH